MTPVISSFKEHENKVYLNLYGDLPPNQQARFRIGIEVRITKQKGTFEKGYLPQWTKEVFTVSQVLGTQPQTYRVETFNEKEIQGTLYEPELQEIDQEMESKIF